jgi:hypothetical protein
MKSRPVSSIGRVLDCELEDWFDSRTRQVTFVVIAHENLSTVIRTVPLLWHVQNFQFLVKVKATSTGKLFDNLPKNDAMFELCSGEFNVAYCRDPQRKLPTPSPP